MWVLLKCYFCKCRHNREGTGRVAKTWGKTDTEKHRYSKKKKKERNKKSAKNQGETDTGKDRHSGEETRRGAKT